MLESPYNSSWLFRDHQDVELAAEALKLARVFADMNFLRASNPDSVLLRDWSQYADFNARTRHALDGLLLAYAVSPREDGTLPGFGEAGMMAGQLEAFVLASPALECRVFEHPTSQGRQGYVIALSGFASDLMAIISWALPTLYHSYQAGEEKPTDQASLEEFFRKYGGSNEAVREADQAIASYLRTWAPSDRQLTAPSSIVPTDSDGSKEGDAALAEAETTHAACQGFLLAHEFTHITQRHFTTDHSPRDLPPHSFLANLPEDTRREVEADCAAFTLTMNSLIIRDGDDPRIPDFASLKKSKPFSRPSRLPGRRRRQHQAMQDIELMVRCVNRATEACLSFYAVVDLLSAVARHRGDEAQAMRFDKVSVRRNVVRGYVQWVREELVHSWGFSPWDPTEAQRWAYLDQHVDYLKRTLVPALDAAPPHRVTDIPATFRRGSPKT